MKTLLGLVAAAGCLLAVTAMKAQAPEPALSLGTYRFYVPASGATTIEGVCEIRLGALFTGARQAARYRFEVQVTDSTGLELLRSDWMRDVPMTVARARNATTVESFSFRAAPGRFHVRVRAIPENGAAVEREADVRAYAARPRASDLLLATAVRRPASDSEAVAPGEVQRAGLFMRTAPTPRLNPTEPSLVYYAEIYPWPGAASAGQMNVAVLRMDGRIVIQTPSRPLEIAAAGGLTRGALDLTGLPEGEYRLRLQVQLGDSSIVADSRFAMGSLESAVGIAAERQAAPRDMFDQADEARLDSLYEPLVYLLDPREQGGLYSSLAVEGKRRFLREFWARRPASMRDEFYASVRYVNEAFREGGAGQIPGWRTDRGRVYLKNGRPDEVLRRPTARRPYEVWRITRGRPRWYVFYDQSGFGHYILLGTNDRAETGLPSWDRYLGPDGSDDVRRFLGLQSLTGPDR